MHQIEPYSRWQKYYRAERDIRSPFFGRVYGNEYVNDVYGYYIDPLWDEFGSETFYCKLLYVDYSQRCCILELFGEWNDALSNDIMYFKRRVIEKLIRNGICKFILIGENLMQFHGGDHDYYEEWIEDIEDGWIALLNLRPHIIQEMTRIRLDYFINLGGTLQISNWRTAKPLQLFLLVNQLMSRRLEI
jgi:hypothetical protein